MSKRSNNPADPFKKALSEATRALAADPDLEVAFSVDPPGLRNDAMRLPQVTRRMSREEVMLARGTADAYALRLRFHDAATHRRYTPQGEIATELFEAMETARCEAVGARAMPGTAGNIDAKIAAEAKRLGYADITDPARAPLAQAAGYFVRHLATGRALPEGAQNVLDLWRGFLESHASGAFEGLGDTLHDQQAFARAARQVISDLGELLSVETISGTMEHAGIRAVFDKIEREEILPHVHPVPDFTPAAYLDLIVSRFANPAVEDTTRRLCLDGSGRQPKFILPSVVDGLADGAPVEGLALASALWCRYCAGEFEDGSPIEPNDPNWAVLTERANMAKTDPGAWLAMQDIYGDLAARPRFAVAFGDWLRMLWSQGTAATITRPAVSTATAAGLRKSASAAAPSAKPPPARPASVSTLSVSRSMMRTRWFWRSATTMRRSGRTAMPSGSSKRASASAPSTKPEAPPVSDETMSLDSARMRWLPVSAM